jgi:hypothetical protein
LECVEVTDADEIARRHPQLSGFPQGTRAMKAGFRYDPAILGDNFQISLVVLKFNPQIGKYMGSGDVEFRAILSGGPTGASAIPAFPFPKPVFRQ